MTVCLFAGRHTLPQNSGPLFEEGPNPFTAAITPLQEDALATMAGGGIVRLLVTGATPALVRFISDALMVRQMGGQGALVLLQYDRDANDYVPTVLFCGEHLRPRYLPTYNLLYDREGEAWDGDTNRLTPQEWDTVHRGFNPGLHYKVRFESGVFNGSIDPYDCE
jgi:hypothetical protein